MGGLGCRAPPSHGKRTYKRLAKAVIRGKAVPAICAERSTSPRTVANQLSSIYRKLRVSGRRELILATLVRDKTTRTPSAVQRAWLD